MAKNGLRENIAVIGLGRFGAAVAETLHSHGHEVLAIDVDPDRVQALADTLPHLVQADCRIDQVTRIKLKTAADSAAETAVETQHMAAPLQDCAAPRPQGPAPSVTQLAEDLFG